MSPTQRTLALLRSEGFQVCIVEKWNMYAKIRQDAFGFGDLLACNESGAYRGTWLIQATTGAHHAARMEKSKALSALWVWLRSGGRFAVVSWSKKGPRGKRKTWESSFEEVTALEKQEEIK